ncbi:hypothetical protein DFH09DRAFT_1074570 [Mycena vulgaris]|nr:hypothetical protein DFH09DRAFT_1074570 [Mycena vulgaris]
MSSAAPFPEPDEAAPLSTDVPPPQAKLPCPLTTIQPKGTIFKYNEQLSRITNGCRELDSYPWRPDEPWPAFFEKHLRPMVYFVHAAATHDFTLVGRKAFYGKEEYAELCYWLEKILMHCSLRDFVAIFGRLGVPIPFRVGDPGESTAMFEILYRLCMSIGFPDVQGMELPINRFTLLPLIVEARKTRAYFNTPADYHPYNKFRGLDDPFFFHPEKQNVLELGW